MVLPAVRSPKMIKLVVKNDEAMVVRCDGKRLSVSSGCYIVRRACLQLG